MPRRENDCFEEMNRFWKYCPESDRQLVGDLLANKEKAVRYLFYDHYRSLLRFNAMKAAPNVPVDDLIQELYMYLSANNWEHLKKYGSSDKSVGEMQ